MKKSAASPKFVSSIIKPAAQSAALLVAQFEEFAVREFGALLARASLHGSHPSRRPCPECEGVMVYQPTRLSAVTGKYLRSCESCGYTDPRPVKMVRQI